MLYQAVIAFGLFHTLLAGPGDPAFKDDSVLSRRRWSIFPSRGGASPMSSTVSSTRPRKLLQKLRGLANKVPWVPVSREDARKAEEGLFRLSGAKVKVYDVDIDQGRRIHTAEGGQNHTTTIVCTAGYGAGLGFFFRNYGNLTSKYHVYAVDLLGWGLSSRPPWPKNVSCAEDAENFFVESLERWRRAVGLNTPFILLGHSYGGYLSTAYATRYASNIKKLLLAGPAGVNDRPVDLFRSPVLKRVSEWCWTRGVTPGKFIRRVGPAGRRIVKLHNKHFFVKKSRGLSEAEVHLFDMYTYHITALPGSGEHSLKHILRPGGVPFAPMAERLTKLEANISFIYGRNDWTDWRYAHKVCRLRKPNTSTLVIIDKAAHHVYLDKPSEFFHAVSLSIDETLPLHLLKHHHGSDEDDILSTSRTLPVAEKYAGEPLLGPASKKPKPKPIPLRLSPLAKLVPPEFEDEEDDLESIGSTPNSSPETSRVPSRRYRRIPRDSLRESRRDLRKSREVSAESPERVRRWQKRKEKIWRGGKGDSVGLEVGTSEPRRAEYRGKSNYADEHKAGRMVRVLQYLRRSRRARKVGRGSLPTKPYLLSLDRIFPLSRRASSHNEITISKNRNTVEEKADKISKSSECREINSEFPLSPFGLEGRFTTITPTGFVVARDIGVPGDERITKAVDEDVEEEGGVECYQAEDTHTGGVIEAN
ncbi:hypothetical protein AAMO2058_001689700 [Amorphochlora amoebiformis]